MDMHFCHLTSQCIETDKPTERNMGILCVRLIFENNGSDYIFQDETRHAIMYVSKRCHFILDSYAIAIMEDWSATIPSMWLKGDE